MAKDLKWAYLIDTYGCLLTDKQLEVIDLYYNEDWSLAEIADNCGITRQGARDFIKRSEAVMAEYEEKLGLCAKRNYIREQVEAIKILSRDISIANDSVGGPVKINEKASAIEERINGLDDLI